MLQTADVLNLKCKFVSSVIESINSAKSVLRQNLNKVISDYSDFMLSFYLKDCLTYDHECKLLDQRFSSLPDCSTTVTPCGDQDTLVLTSNSYPCIVFFQTKNLYDTSRYPTLSLISNSILQTAQIGVTTPILSNSCNALVTNYVVDAGCQTGTCSDTFLTKVGINSFLQNVASLPDSYVTTMRLYTTDATGANPIPLNVDLRPSNLSTWTACGGCLPITASDLEFDSGNFEFAFDNLLENVSRTLYGANYSSFVIQSIPAFNGFRIASDVKHNPSSRYIGINKSDYNITYYNSLLSSEVSVTDTTISQQATYFDEDITISTPCGDVDRTISSGTTGFTFPLNSTTTNFNFIGLASPNSTTPFIQQGYVQCANILLTATFTNTAASMEWKNEADEVLSTTYTIVVTEEGVYTFTLTTDKGCVFTKTITV